MAAWTALFPFYFCLILCIVLCEKTATSFGSTASCVPSHCRTCGPRSSSAWICGPGIPRTKQFPARSTFPLLRSSTRNQERKADDGFYAMERHYKHFLRNFWKGMALPFPQLRNVLLPRSLKVLRGRKGDSSSFTVGLSFREGLMALGLYLASGVLAYSVILEKWSIIDAL